MQEMALTSCHNRHKTRSLTNSKKARGDGYPNILRDQEFPIAARMGLTSDITYLKTGEGFMYHCVIRDIVTGDVLGDHMADRMTKELVVNAIKAMLAAAAKASSHSPRACAGRAGKCGPSQRLGPISSATIDMIATKDISTITSPLIEMR